MASTTEVSGSRRHMSSKKASSIDSSKLEKILKFDGESRVKLSDDNQSLKSERTFKGYRLRGLLATKLSKNANDSPDNSIIEFELDDEDKLCYLARDLFSEESSRLETNGSSNELF